MNSLYFGAKVDTTNPDSWACGINGTGAIDSADLQALYIGSLYSKPLITTTTGLIIKWTTLLATGRQKLQSMD